MHSPVVLQRYDRHQKYQHAHAADPMGKAAPEQTSLAHGLHIRQNGSAGGGKAADGLKKGIDIVGDLLAEIKGKGPDGRNHDPGKANDNVAFLGINDFAGRTRQKSKGQSYHQRHCNSQQEIDQAPLPV